MMLKRADLLRKEGFEMILNRHITLFDKVVYGFMDVYEGGDLKLSFRVVENPVRTSHLKKVPLGCGSVGDIWECSQWKVKNKTAIPAGEYVIEPRYDFRKESVRWCVMDVPQFHTVPLCENGYYDYNCLPQIADLKMRGINHSSPCLSGNGMDGYIGVVNYSAYDAFCELASEYKEGLLIVSDNLDGGEGL